MLGFAVIGMIASFVLIRMLKKHNDEKESVAE